MYITDLDVLFEDLDSSEASIVGASGWGCDYKPDDKDYKPDDKCDDPCDDDNGKDYYYYRKPYDYAKRNLAIYKTLTKYD